MKKLLCLSVFIILMVGQSVYAEDIKIGFVDLIQALNESESGKKAKTDLEFLIQSKQKAIDGKGIEIEKLRGDLQKQASILSADARKSKEEELERLVREYQRLVTDSQEEVKKKESDLTLDIIKELRVIIEKIGQDEGYTLILENVDGLILHSKKEFDLTDAVIMKFNESTADKPE